MNWTEPVCVLPMNGQDGHHSQRATASSQPRLSSPLRTAILRTRQWLLSEQEAGGYWVGELEGDSILESEFILLLAYLGRENSDLANQAPRYLVAKQLEAGGWAKYPDGPIDISASVKAYFALKLTGHDPSDEPMQRARRAILAGGGADQVNSFTRFYLALLGQISYEQCPAVPPEAILLPGWFPINLSRVSAWSRTIIVPLSIISAFQPVRRVDSRRGIRELFLAQPEDWPPLRCPGQQGGTGLLSWDRFFRMVDRSLKFCRRHDLLPLRRRAIAKAEQWMLERFEESDGLGAIFPPMVWSIIALDSLGYDRDSAEMQYCQGHLEDLVILNEEEDTARLEPCKSPVWDTAISLRALANSGVTHEHDAVTRAIDWLLAGEIRRRGDWADIVHAEPGGWCFEHNNAFYPDLDDTAMVLMALHEQLDDPRQPPSTLPPDLQLLSHHTVPTCKETRRKADRVDRITATVRRAIAWMLAMQNDDGGWGAFDRNNDHEFLCHVPFADHNAMIDPSTPDLTARVLEALGMWGHRVGKPHVDRAVAYVRRTQEADGSWLGRWGVNYIYGTWQVLAGLAEVGVATDDPAIAAGADWLLAHQQPCGGWGESPESYADPSLRGEGPVTASQTA